MPAPRCYTRRMQIRERLQALRAAMAARNIDAYIIPSGDPHQSEYPPEHWRARSWITGFDGSAGTAVVTADGAGLWTDFRYFLHAEKSLAGTGIALFKSGEPGVAEYPEWLVEVLEEGSVVSFDRMSLSLSSARAVESCLSPHDIAVKPGDDLFEEIWEDRPPLPRSPLQMYDARFAGASRGEKLSAVRTRMQEAGADHHIISTLDDIAWLLNVRGADVRYLPVAVAHVVVSRESVQLFIDEAKVEGGVRSALESDGVVTRPYEEFLDAVGELTGAVLVSPEQTSAGTAGRLGTEVRRVEQTNLPTVAKAHKNSTELEHIRQVMVRDGVAMVRFLRWLDEALDANDGAEDVTEISAELKLTDLRSQGENFVSPSFRTISAYRAHGAIVHYAATDESDALLEPTGLYLLDSGGQYLDGTTDITRTIALGTPTDEERYDYTLVLKGLVALAMFRFPVGTTGPMLDAVARQHMWRERVNYGHGTGHGVGFFLSVHEPPQRINQKPSDVALGSGMLTSIEPGLYRPGLHGVRIENLVVVSEPVRSEFGEFLEFETVTLCPFDRSLIDVSKLTDEELEWVNDYHRRVRDRLLGFLDGRCAEWLEEACEPLQNREI